MREVQIRAWCDFCWADGEQKVESTTAFAIGVVQSMTRGPMPKMLEVCDVHAKPLTELSEMVVKLPAFVPEKVTAKPKMAVAAHSAPSSTLFDPDRVSPSQQPLDCPICGVTLTQKGAVVGHVWSHHASIPKPESPTVCPNCGERSRTAQGMATHRRFEHNYDALEDALSYVPEYRASVPRELTA